MKCAGCVSSVEKALAAVDGVTEVSVNLAERLAFVDGAADSDDLLKAVEHSGFRAAVLSSPEDEQAAQDLESRQYRLQLYRSLLALAVAAPLMISGWLGMMPSPANTAFWIPAGIALLAVMLFSGQTHYLGAIRSWRHPNMDTLIAIGTLSAWGYSSAVVLLPEAVPSIAQHLYYEAGLVILGLVGLGNALEHRARGQTSAAIRSMMDLQPETARVLRNGEELDVPLNEVGLDETIRLRTGDRIPVDGLVLQGEGEVDEAMLTGESESVAKYKDDELLAGTVVQSGTLLMQSTLIGQQTVLARIIQQVRKAQASKPAIARMVDQVAAVFVPVVLLIAIATFVLWWQLGPEPSLAYAWVTSVTVLVIACPCALGLATPIALMVSVGRAAKMGLLIRNGDVLQAARQLDAIILDKTGTLTLGKPQVVDVQASAGMEADALLSLAASLEQGSTHPLAEAIVQAAKDKSLTVTFAQQLEQVSGMGVRAKVADDEVVLGRFAFLLSHDIDRLPEQEPDNPHSLVFVAVNGDYQGWIALADAINPTAQQAIDGFKARGLRVSVVSGDRQSAVASVAESLGIDEVLAGVLPQDKLSEVKRLQGQGLTVAMVGDGINDAPALAQADVGIAMSNGTDVAMDTADMTLMNSDLTRIVDAIALSSATVRNIKQNLFGAFIYNSLSIPLAAGALFFVTGWLLSPMVAGAAMALSSVTVVSNANRLRAMSLEK